MTSGELIKLYQETGDETYFNQLYKMNYRLITTIVNKYFAYDMIICGYDDYLSEANIAFYKGCMKYSPLNKIKFSTYIHNCIENSCKDVQKKSKRDKRDMGYTLLPIHGKLNRNDESSLYIEDTVSYEEDVMYRSMLEDNENELYGVLHNYLSNNQYEGKTTRTDILRLLNEGYSQKDIAKMLNKTHQNISAVVKVMRRDISELGYRV